MHLNLQEFYGSHSPAQMMHLEGARWQRYMMHQRQAEIQHSPYPVAMPCSSATIKMVQTNVGKPNRSSADKTPETTKTSTKIYSCVPSVEVALISKSLSAQTIDTFGPNCIDKSVFALERVLQNLHRTVTHGASRCTELTVSIGEHPERSMDAGNVCRLAFPLVSRSGAGKSVQSTGTLFAPQFCTRSFVVGMCDALLRLRQLLPSEISIRVDLPMVQKRNAVRQAALCLLEEFKLLAVAKRIRCEKNRTTQTRGALVNTTSVEDEAAVAMLLDRRVHMAKLESDQAIAFMFSVLRM